MNNFDIPNWLLYLIGLVLILIGVSIGCGIKSRPSDIQVKWFGNEVIVTVGNNSVRVQKGVDFP